MSARALRFNYHVKEQLRLYRLVEIRAASPPLSFDCLWEFAGFVEEVDLSVVIDLELEG